MLSYKEKKQAIREAYLQLAINGFMTRKEAMDAGKCLNTLSAADVMVEYKNHVSQVE